MEHVLVSRTGAVTEITLNRPEVMNALTVPVLEAVAAAFEAATADGTRVVVLRATGAAFCSGADLADDELGKPEVQARVIDVANGFVKAVASAAIPVVSVIHGPAVGMGLSLALAADLPIMSTSAYLLLGFTKIGLMPDGGASALAAAGIGRAAAMRMALLAERVPADRALELGLVAAAVAPEQLEDEVQRIVGILAGGAPQALAHTKQAINALSLGDLDGALAAERTGQLHLLGSSDFAEGVAAFRERRAPRFGTAQR
ncbi:enoyl-CoA hydratase-related protein [Leifsonia sp. H3M29-4]|uniref:enoyl-CoA hydratase-related protein n=1 Tax=Salinibacterium metalliresistens TaxID=3031321 RepID=UPI0023DB859C|nr:enoyl-CoA hydratase-related protein [Salinibacterium metalliresistens]MDF1477917.1 enoyl-CoA hydratase-related protein [Salinibacterium metalliresistens]